MTFPAELRSEMLATRKKKKDEPRGKDVERRTKSMEHCEPEYVLAASPPYPGKGERGGKAIERGMGNTDECKWPRRAGYAKEEIFAPRRATRNIARRPMARHHYLSSTLEKRVGEREGSGTKGCSKIRVDVYRQVMHPIRINIIANK